MLALRAVGAAQGCPGGETVAWVWGVRGQALSHPRLSALWAGGRGPLPTGCGCGGVRPRTPVTNPTMRAFASWLCALWGRRDGARGDASCLGMGRPGSGALPPPTARPLGELPGPTTHWLWVRGGPGVGTRHQLHSALSCVLWGRHEGAPGGRLLPGCGASGVGRSPTPAARPLGGLPGPTTHWLWVRGGCGRGNRHQPDSARSYELWGRHVGAPGGRLLPGCGAFGVGRTPTPDCPPSGPAAGAHYPLAVGVGGCGRGDPSTTLQRAGFARCGGGMRVPGGGASYLGVGRPGSGALQPPTARPLGGLPGPTTHWLWGRGDACVGTRLQPHSARSCELAVRAVGAARGRPGGGASCLGVGRPGSGALPPPTARPLGGLPGPTTHWLWVWGGAGLGTRHQPHSALALHAVGAA